MNALRNLVEGRRIAYISMEIALHPEIPTYSGGLGLLAGDFLRSAADLELPLVGVTLASREGYVRQELDEHGGQVDRSDPWDPAARATPLGARVSIPIQGRDVWVRAWLYVVEGASGGRVPVVLLDTDVRENSAEDRRITDRLYGDGPALRLSQEIVLGIGGVRMLHALGFEIRAWHMNEGHSALLGLELLSHLNHRRPEAADGRPPWDLSRVRDLCCFTTHTAVDAAFDHFPWSVVSSALADTTLLDDLRALAPGAEFSPPRLAAAVSGYINGVAERHSESSRRLFPGYRIHAISNGIHLPTWTCPSFARLFQERLPQWRHEPETLVRADLLDDDAVWEAHDQAKLALVEKVRQESGVALDPAKPILGWARRMTGYKRPDLLFTEPAQLVALARKYPFQVVFAGKAHPSDGAGKSQIRRLHGLMREMSGSLPVAFIPNYDMGVSQFLVSGCDVWLNTPQPPLEASGTSGMKAALNGVLNLSTLDGWWLEGCVDGVTGWSIGKPSSPQDSPADAASLYDRLGQDVLPTYHADRRRWVWMMKQAISKIAPVFNTHRMMRRYATEAYLR